MGLLGKVRTAAALPLKEQVWFLLLFPYSGLIRVMMLLVPFRLLSRCFGRHIKNDQLSPLVSEPQLLLALRIGRITGLTARYTPWKSECLAQAVMARTLLGFYGIPYIMHLGARMTGDVKEPMRAHVWIKVGGRVVSGGEGHRAFGIVGSYVSPSVMPPSSSRFDS